MGIDAAIHQSPNQGGYRHQVIGVLEIKTDDKGVVPRFKGLVGLVNHLAHVPSFSQVARPER